MEKIKKMVIGNIAEVILRTIFSTRISEESTSDELNKVSRARKIYDLQNKVIGFVKRQPNSVFQVEIPEYESDKRLKLEFSNFPDEYDEDDDETCHYNIIIEDNFVIARVLLQTELGEPIRTTLKAE